METLILNIDPVAFHIGSFPVRWYALAYLAGFVVGWKYCLSLVSREEGTRPNAEDIDDFLVWAVVGVILGGRLGYVLFYNFDFYLNNPGEIYQVWKGGMSFHGGMIGVLFAMFAFEKRRKINILRLSDIICAAAPIGLFFGRIANFVNAELYGKVTTVPWGVVFPNGGDVPRHPSQLYEALLEGLVLFIILYFMTRSDKVKDGMVSGVFLIGYGVSRALVEFVREPDAQIGYIAGFVTMGQLLCLPMVIIGIMVVMFSKKGTLTRGE